MTRIAYVLTLFFVLSVPALAQEINSFSGRVIVSAKVIQSIELITINTMTFGNTQPGQKEIVVNPVTDPNAGYMIANGTPNTEFRLDYLPVRNLTNTDGVSFLTFEYLISANDIEDQASSELLEDENRTIKFNSNGIYHIWVGGRVNLENARPGNYEGDFTIEIEYI